MEPFTTMNGLVMPLNRANVDTDAIIPARYLKSIKRTGFSEALFGNWRYLEDGITPDPDFVLNEPRYKNATVLLARENFGCGSSREHAPWALKDYGFRCLISSGFADIFYNNCFNNGILPITLSAEEVEELFQEVDAEPGLRLRVDLTEQTVTAPGGRTFKFEIDSFKRESLLQGLDNIGLTLSHSDAIDQYEQHRQTEAPWLFAAATR
jgi:3-isopropylmalate/(R)-2-methylmalate dehydratase small subunit